jgi:hypothetical protein
MREPSGPHIAELCAEHICLEQISFAFTKRCEEFWMPAYAGMTEKVYRRVSF